MTFELGRILNERTSDTPGRVVYGVATADNTVAVRGSSVAVEMPALSTVHSGDYCAVWEQGADRLILGAVDRASTSFTPTWTNVTTTTATQDFAYRYVPGGMVIDGTFTFGASTAFTGAPQLTLPDSASSSRIFGGTATYFDGSRIWIGAAYRVSSTRVGFAHSESGNNGIVNATAPFTFASGNTLSVRSLFVPL